MGLDHQHKSGKDALFYRRSNEYAFSNFQKRRVAKLRRARLKLARDHVRALKANAPNADWNLDA